MRVERDVRLRDGRVLRAHDTGGQVPGELAIVWHHGSPQTGTLLPPLLDAAARRGIRLLSYGRPSYGGSSPCTGRDVASAAADVAQLADALGLDRFAVMGASGGGPHALACAALLPERVSGAVCLAGLAPFTADFDWFAGMADDGGLRAAVAGREERARYAVTEEFDPASFTAADRAALSGTCPSSAAAQWRWTGSRCSTPAQGEARERWCSPRSLCAVPRNRNRRLPPATGQADEHRGIQRPDFACSAPNSPGPRSVHRFVACGAPRGRMPPAAVIMAP